MKRFTKDKIIFGLSFAGMHIGVIMYLVYGILLIVNNIEVMYLPQIAWIVFLLSAIVILWQMHKTE